jgi:hypothetical protein
MSDAAQPLDSRATSCGGEAMMPASPESRVPRGDTRFTYPRSYQQSEPFAKPHTVTILLVLVAFVLYAVTGRDQTDSVKNIKW